MHATTVVLVHAFNFNQCTLTNALTAIHSTNTHAYHCSRPLPCPPSHPRPLYTYNTGLRDVLMDVDYPRKRGGVRRSIVLVMELAPGGELFDYMFHTGSFPERVARAYVFKKT